MTSSRSSCSCRRAPGKPGLPEERGCRLGSANAGSGTALELSPGLRLGALVWPALSWAPGSAATAGPAAAGLRCNACICAAHCSQPRLLCCIVEMFRAEVWIFFSGFTPLLPQRGPPACPGGTLALRSPPRPAQRLRRQRWLWNRRREALTGIRSARLVAFARSKCGGGRARPARRGPPHPLDTASLGALPQACAVTCDSGGVFGRGGAAVGRLPAGCPGRRRCGRAAAGSVHPRTALWQAGAVDGGAKAARPPPVPGGGPTLECRRPRARRASPRRRGKAGRALQDPTVRRAAQWELCQLPSTGVGSPVLPGQGAPWRGVPPSQAPSLARMGRGGVASGRAGRAGRDQPRLCGRGRGAVL